MAEAFGMQAEASAKNVQEILKQIRLEEELAAAKESNYKTTLEAMRDAFEKDGIAGFDKELNKLDSSALKTILSMYGKLGELAEVAMKQGKDAALALLDELIAEANGKAAELREKALTDGAKGYADRQEAQEAKNTGFQSQLIELRDALTDGTFMEVLASFKQEVADALLGEHDWLNGVIENYERIKAGTLDVTDVLNQFNEHIIGTDEQFLASAEAMVEANRTLLQTEEEQIEVLSRLYEALSEDDGLESFKDAWNGLGEEMQEALIKKVPVVNELLGDLNKGA